MPQEIILKTKMKPEEIQEIKKRIKGKDVAGISLKEINEFEELLNKAYEYNSTVICPKCGHEFEIEE